jgi:hypothetical protein
MSDIFFPKGDAANAFKAVMFSLCRLSLLGLSLSITAGVVAAEETGFRLTETEVVAEAGRIDAALRFQAEKQRQSGPDTPMAEPALAAAKASEAVFLRRACIDLAGRLPEADEARAFLADAAADKRARLVDRLLLEAGADEWRFQRLADALRVKDTVLGQSQQAYIDWLKAEMRQQTPFDELLQKLLTAQGTVESNPAVGLLLRDGGDLKVTASELARALFGENLHCAHCHDHPFADWTQKGMTQFAACFGAVKVQRGFGAAQMAERVKVSSSLGQGTILPAAKPVGRRGREVSREVVQVELTPGQLWPDAALTRDPLRSLTSDETLRVEANPTFIGLALPARYAYRDGKAGELVAARPLRWEAPPPTGAKRIQGSMEGLATWWTERANPRFTAATALRVWQWLFGPVENEAQSAWRESATAPVSPSEAVRQESCGFPPKQTTATGLDPDWLQERWFQTLSSVLLRCRMDLREFQRVLARTEAYQRAGQGPQPHAPVPLHAPQIRRLPAEVVWDALVSWLPEQTQDSRSIDLPQAPDGTHPLRLLGRGSREWADESLPVVSFSVARFFQEEARVRQAAVELAMRSVGAAGLDSPDRQVETLFLTILGRLPEQAEQARAMQFAKAAGPAELAWSLINSAEFLFQP